MSYDLRAELVPEDVEWRPAPLPRPRIDGPQIATVVGPAGEEIHCDEWGRVKVQFPWDREGRHDEFSTCWIRVAQNWAGADWGHMAIPRIGQEVIVDYLDGDCDQPIVTGRTYRATNRPPYALPDHKILSTIKSKEYKGSRANELRIDDTTAQISAALMSDHGASALHLGYLTHPRPEGGKPRGEGFELRTDEHGAVRAAKGLLLSTEEQLRAGAGHLDRGVVVQVLEAALELARELGDYAGEHQGVGHDAAPQQTLQEAVRDLGHGANDESGKSNGGKPAIALSGPAGIAAATPASLTLAAGEHVDSVARQNQQVTAGQKVVINAGSDIGLFAQGGELRQITHQGPMLLQAQKNDIRLEAEQSVEVSASQQHVLVTAKEHITLMCGGAYLTLKGGNIELGMPGNFVVKAVKHSHVGAASLEAELPQFEVGETQRRFVLKQLDGQTAMPNVPYTITMANGEVIEGVTDAEGATQLLQKDAMNIAKVDMKHEIARLRSCRDSSGGWRGGCSRQAPEWPRRRGRTCSQRRGNQPGERRIRRFHRLFHGPPARRGLCPLAGQGLRDGAERPHLLRRGVARRGGLEPGEPAAPGSVHSRNDPCLAAPAWRQRPSGGAYQQARQFLLGDQYAYRLEPGKTLKDYNIEQQGDIVRDYFLEKNEFGEASANSRFAGVLKNFPTGY